MNVRSLAGHAALLLVIPALSALGGEPLDSLVSAERDFARLSVEKGMRPAFDAYFADDGIWFTPHPEKTRAALAKQPDAPPTRLLDWTPAFSDVSSAGDLGFNTGPFSVSERSGERKTLMRGEFFSVWKRQADGAWKVALDFGVPLAASAPSAGAVSWRAARGARWEAKRAVDLPAERAALFEREKALAREAGARGTAAAYAAAMAEELHVLREGTGRVVEKGRLASLLESEAGALSFEPKFADVARSADLGYTWGSFTRTPPAGPVEKGYYAHVWRRDASSAWRLAVEVRSALPPPKEQ